MTSAFQHLIGQEITWVPTATFKERYSLIGQENTIIATLDMSNWTSKADATVPEGILFFQKETWSGLKIAVSLGEQGMPFCTYQRKLMGTSGQLLFPDGRELKWGKSNFWGTQKAWTDSSGDITYVQFSTGSFSRKVNVVIKPEAASIPEISLLLVLGMYNILAEKRASASAVAASTSASF